MGSPKFSIKERIKSFSYAISGIVDLIRSEHNARIHLTAACLVIALSYLLQIDKIEWLFIFLSISIVFITELLNTAIEKMADIIQPEYDNRIKIIKDFSAGAVLISAVFAVITAGLILLPKLIAFII